VTIETSIDVSHEAGVITMIQLDTEPNIVGDLVTRRIKHVADTKDAAVRKALIELGWTPPEHPVAKLARFGLKVLKAHRDIGGPFDVDGGDLQEFAEKTGVLEKREVREACGERCTCAEIGGFDAFPIECYFVPSEISELLKD
jgi:hypothetical protein